MNKLVNRALKKFQSLLAANAYDGQPQFNCSVCGSTTYMLPLPSTYFFKMHEHRCIHNIFLYETLNLEHYSCSHCGASDRSRLYALYLQKYLSKTEAVNILDIAPALELALFIKRFQNIQYRSTDLYMPGVDDVQSITDMHLYTDEQFDFLICSHVLEHIPDDRKAMAELYRVLQKGGKGIVMVPINMGVEQTIEDPTVTDIPTRWRLFGQDDHIRMYAKDEFIQRLSDVGFTVELLDKNYFGEDVFRQAAVFSGSVLYMVTK